jgi:RecB family endonuclease NucS
MKTKTKESPENSELFDFINKSLAKRAFITLIAHCKIKFNGKTLESRDRIIMIKPDGTFIVHDASNSEPLYSLPPKSKFQTKIENKIIYFNGYNENTLESIELEIYKAHLASCHIA